MHPMTTRSDTVRLQHRIGALERDKQALEVRVRPLPRALNAQIDGQPIVARPITTTGRTGAIWPLVTMAQHLELNGRVPVVRFTRDDAATVSGIELSSVETREPESPAITDREMMREQLREMVVGGLE